MADAIAKPKAWIATMVQDGRFIKAFREHDQKLEREYKVEESFYREYNAKLLEHTPHTPRILRHLSAEDLRDLSDDLSGYECGFESEFVGPLNLRDALCEMTRGDLYSVVFQLAYTVLCMERLGIIHEDLYAESNILVSRLEQPRTATYVVDGRATNVRMAWMVYVIDFDQANLWNDGIGGHDMFEAMESLAKYDERFYITPGWILTKQDENQQPVENRGLTPCDVMFEWLAKDDLLETPDDASSATYTAPMARG